MIKEKTKLLWENWIKITNDRCHLHFELEHNNLNKHIKICIDVGDQTAERVYNDINLEPKNILDIGSSVGFNSIGLSQKYKDSLIVGIEPDKEACQIANKMAQDFKKTNVRFVSGVCETLPFCDNQFDLIICHTVIEHVRNVENSIDEISRVLKPDGLLHIEAPNYIWPWEPHLGIVTTPLCPKPLMRFLAKLQKAGNEIYYIDHLQPVNPIWLERLFKKNNLTWINRSKTKYLKAAREETKDIAASKNLTLFYKFFSFLRFVGVATFLAKLALKFNFYPSILYTVKK